MIAIDIKNLNKSYENGLKALKNINLPLEVVRFLLYWVQMEQENQH